MRIEPASRPRTKARAKSRAIGGLEAGNWWKRTGLERTRVNGRDAQYNTRPIISLSLNPSRRSAVRNSDREGSRGSESRAIAKLQRPTLVSFTLNQQTRRRGGYHERASERIRTNERMNERTINAYEPRACVCVCAYACIMYLCVRAKREKRGN